ncbi:MAG: methionine--tRNA ligase [Candidatus Dormibacteria bacterium]
MTSEEGRFYVTAAIDYVNAAPHLGTAYEKIGCDVLTRYHSLCGQETRFVMGSDEHSQSVARAAEAAGLTPQEFCSQQKELFQSTWNAFSIQPTHYVQTDSAENRASTSAIMQRIYDAGHIYKGAYKAWYCPSCEQFYTDKQITDNQCPVHERPLEWIEEENYFFRLSAFQEELKTLFEQHPDFLVPETRRNEILNVIEGGLEDISISRAFTSWGIPLPFDATQVVYVWFDALLSYLTGIGFPHEEREFARFWPADVHVIGKDITRFHAVMWPAMLLAAGLPLPRKIHAHGFITLGGQKMSKTRGIFLDPMQLVKSYGSDAVRWVLMAEIPFDRDGDFSIEVFVDRYNADLANDYGNLISRTEKMCLKYFGGEVPAPGTSDPLDDELEELVRKTLPRYESCFATLDLAGALQSAMTIVRRANKYIEESAPWSLAAAGDVRLRTVIRNLLETIRVATVLLAPFIPHGTTQVAGDFGLTIDANAMSSLKGPWLTLKEGTTIGVGAILYPRLNREEVLSREPSQSHAH